MHSQKPSDDPLGAPESYNDGTPVVGAGADTESMVGSGCVNIWHVSLTPDAV